MGSARCTLIAGLGSNEVSLLFEGFFFLGGGGSFFYVRNAESRGIVFVGGEESFL
jgi:hypothetical protein